MALEGKYALTIKRQQDGFASGWILDNWKVGDEITVSGPEGTFCYEPLRDAKHVVGLAGGCGITPVSLTWRTPSATEWRTSGLPCSMAAGRNAIFSTTASWRELPKRPARSRSSISSATNKRKATSTALSPRRRFRPPAEANPCSVFLCGARRDVRVCGQRGGKAQARGQVYPSRTLCRPFFPRQAQGLSGGADNRFTLTVKRYGDTLTLPMSADETVLVALERAGVAAPSRCRGGECGWCRAKLDKAKSFCPRIWISAAWRTFPRVTSIPAARTRSATSASKSGRNKEIETSKRRGKTRAVCFDTEMPKPLIRITGARRAFCDPLRCSFSSLPRRVGLRGRIVPRSKPRRSSGACLRRPGSRSLRGRAQYRSARQRR